jgi:hypothetical protein
MWCWVRAEWWELRWATFYAPVWFAIVCTVTTYAVTGRKILESRRELKRFAEATRNTITPAKGETNDNTELSNSGSDVGIILSSMSSNPAHTTGETGEKGRAWMSIASRHPNRDAGRVSRSTRNRSAEAHSVAFAYAQCAILFFVALLVIWVGRSI